MAQNKKKIAVQSKKQRKEDDPDKKRLRRFLFIYAPIIVITLIFVYALSFDPVKQASRKQIQSTLLETVESPSGSGAQNTYRVRLADGHVVTVIGQGKKAVSKGTGMLIEESETLLFKRKIYQFIQVKD
jgi:hypothetical protein